MRMLTLPTFGIPCVAATMLLLLSGHAAVADNDARPPISDKFAVLYQPTGDWYEAGDAMLNPDQNRLLVGKPGAGVLINGKIGRTNSLVTKETHQDVQVHVEFMVAKGSNSGVIFHGNYEIQILDSAHIEAPTGAHCGGVYPRAEGEPGTPSYRHIDAGSPPRVNAAKPPGQWQTMDITFQSPRFDEDGNKTANAKFVKVVHNGAVVQENHEMPYAHGPNWDRKQSPNGRVILQGDYGPIAFRNIRVRPWADEEEANSPGSHRRQTVGDDGDHALASVATSVHEPPRSRELGYELLAQIDTSDLPEGYEPTEHQQYVDQRMEALSDQQRGRISQLWEEKQRIDPDMPNRGFSFVKILAYVAEGETLPAEDNKQKTPSMDDPAKSRGGNAPESRASKPVNGWKWSAETDEQGTNRKASPFETPEGPTIYVVPFGVLEDDNPPVVLLPESRLAVTGRLATSHPVYFGITINHPNGDFAGRFLTIRPADEFQSGKDFQVTLAFQDFQLDSSLSGMKGKLPNEPFHFVIESIWFTTLEKKAELEIAEVELTPPSPESGSSDAVNRVGGSGDPPTTGKRNPPNVLFVAVDDLNDWVGCLGGHPQAKTPNIDRLAEKGVLFEQAYCAAPLCSPSRTAVMTGLRPSTTGIYGNLAWFRDIPKYKDWVTIPQYFRKHGYMAVTGGKIYHQPRGKFSDPIAWDEQYSMQMGTPFPPESSRYRHGMHDLFNNKILARLIDWGPIDQPTEQTDDWKTADKAAQFLKQDHDKPFFLACGIYHPHLPWYVPQKYFDMHPLESIQLPARREDDLDDIPPVGLRMAGKAFGIIKEHGQWKDAVQGRLASGSFADACVGHVLNALECSRHRDNTIVVLWGDHGYDIGQKKFAKSALWEQTSRTPLIISAPGVSSSGGRCKYPVSLVDLYPTLIELCGLPDRDDLDGQSLAPLIRAPEAEWPYPAIITHSPHWHGTNHAIRSELYHYIHYSDGGEELYDMPNDPNQWKNLATDPAYSEIKEKLKQWLPKANAEHFRPEQ